MAHVPQGEPRFRIVPTQGGESLVIPKRRRWSVVVPLSIQMVIVLLAPLMMALAPGSVDWGWSILPGIAFFCLILALNASLLLWELFGEERLTVADGDLKVTHAALRLRRSRLFEGRAINNLGLSPWANWLQLQRPFGWGIQAGTVSFSYGGRSVTCAQGLDMTEARLVVDHLRQRLPGAA